MGGRSSSTGDRFGATSAASLRQGAPATVACCSNVAHNASTLAAAVVAITGGGGGDCGAAKSAATPADG